MCGGGGAVVIVVDTKASACFVLYFRRVLAFFVTTFALVCVSFACLHISDSLQRIGAFIKFWTINDSFTEFYTVS